MMAFKFDFTRDKLAKLFPAHKDIAGLHAALSTELPKYGIDTVERVAGFLSQCGHESLGFTVMRENLNYRAETLLRVFPKYYKTQADAEAHAHKPEKIANRVYGGRMGNGPEATGEGFKFRGRGFIQLTGKTNYTLFAESVNKNLDDTVNYLETTEGAIESACWFWKKNGLNELSDKKDVLGMTRRINGGTNGLDDRRAKWDKAMKVLP